MNEPSQLSHDNPGWRGPGEPGWRDLGAQLRPVLRLAAEGQFSASFHRAESVLSNAWHFRVRPVAGAAVCPCCGWEGPAFLATGNWRAYSPQSRCPQCDSRSRHRGLVHVLPDLLLRIPDGPVLVFAPERILMERLPSLTDNPIVTTDYLSADVDYPGEDIQSLGFADNQFAFIMCNHVLEHVPDDRRAMQECARVLKPGGMALFTMPGDYHLRDTRHFAEPDSNGHLRHYAADAAELVAEAFGLVEVIDLSAQTDPRWHVHRGEPGFLGIVG